MHHIDRNKEIFYVDETSYNLWMWPQRVWWHRKSHFKHTIPPGRNCNMTTLGAISSYGRFYW